MRHSSIGSKWVLIGDVDATEVMTAAEESGLIPATEHSFHQGIPVSNIIRFKQKTKELGARK
ncbi:MAG: hypothetical protein ACLFST_06505 [Spirochaetia bacterium]